MSAPGADDADENSRPGGHTVPDASRGGQAKTRKGRGDLHTF